MLRARTVLILLLAALTAPSITVAQGRDTLPIGTRIRAATTGRRAWLSGTMAGFRHDTLLVQIEPDVVTRIAVSDIERLEMSIDQRTHVVEGLGTGLLFGAAIGAAIGAATSEDSYLGPGVYAMLGAGAGAFGGLLIGGVVGASIHTDRWRPAPGWKLGVAVRVAGPGIGVAIGF